MKISIKELYIKIILLFPIFTLFQSYIGFLNKLLFFFLIIVQVVLIIRKIHYKSFILLITVLFLEIWAIVNTKLPLYNVNDAFYFPFMILYFEYFIYHKDELINTIVRNCHSVKNVIYIWNLLVFISFFMPSSYSSHMEWGGGVYFQSFTNTPFRLCPAALFIMTLVLVVMMLEKNKNFIFFSIVPMCCFFSSGSRIYFGIGILLFMIIWYRYFYNKQAFWLSLIPLAILLVILFLNSSIMKKFASTMYTENSFFDFWGTITNGRTVFWAGELQAFCNTSVIHQILGNGFNYVYDVNYKTIHSRIWAHNDFLQVLTTYGYAGLFVYIVSISRLFRYCLTSTDDNKEKMVIYLSVAIWLFNAFFNMFYTYFCAMLSFPFLISMLRYPDRRIK